MKNVSSNGIVINVDEAVIHTATIGIKMLTIDRRKVTLGLFRQFKQRRFLDPASGTPNGTAWGLINYFWGDCNQIHEHRPYDYLDLTLRKEGRHLHVLWQGGTELFRDCIYPGYGPVHADLTRSAKEQSNVAVCLVLWAVHHNAQDFTLATQSNGKYGVFHKGDARRWFLWPKQRFFVHDMGRNEYDFPLLGAAPGNPYYTQNTLIPALRKTIDPYYSPEMSVTEIWDQSFELDDAAIDLRARATKLGQQWEKELQALEKLDQLFIAG